MFLLLSLARSVDFRKTLIGEWNLLDSSSPPSTVYTVEFHPGPGGALNATFWQNDYAEPERKFGRQKQTRFSSSNAGFVAQFRIVFTKDMSGDVFQTYPTDARICSFSFTPGDTSLSFNTVIDGRPLNITFDIRNNDFLVTYDTWGTLHMQKAEKLNPQAHHRYNYGSETKPKDPFDLHSFAFWFYLIAAVAAVQIALYFLISLYHWCCSSPPPPPKKQHGKRKKKPKKTVTEAEEEVAESPEKEKTD
jgi:hypothetical protein